MNQSSPPLHTVSSPALMLCAPVWARTLQPYHPQFKKNKNAKYFLYFIHAALVSADVLFVKFLCGFGCAFNMFDSPPLISIDKYGKLQTALDEAQCLASAS